MASWYIGSNIVILVMAAILDFYENGYSKQFQLFLSFQTTKEESSYN